MDLDLDGEREGDRLFERERLLDAEGLLEEVREGEEEGAGLEESEAPIDLDGVAEGDRDEVKDLEGLREAGGVLEGVREELGVGGARGTWVWIVKLLCNHCPLGPAAILNSSTSLTSSVGLYNT